MTRRPPHRPGRAGFLPPVPRVDSLPRRAVAHAYTRRRRDSVMRGRSMGPASTSWVQRGQLTLLRVPPRRLRHVKAPAMAQSQTRERAWQLPWTPSSRECPRNRALRPSQQACPGPGRCACLHAWSPWPARGHCLRAVRRLTRGTPCRSAVPEHSTPTQVTRRVIPGGTRLTRRLRVFSEATFSWNGPRRCGSAWENHAASRRHRQAQPRSSASRLIKASPRQGGVTTFATHRATASCP